MSREFLNSGSGAQEPTITITKWPTVAHTLA